MKKTEFAIMSFALILFFLVGPITAGKEKSPEERQEQVAESSEYHITYRTKGTKEKSVADILWLKKAAKVAMGAGVPYFNVKEKSISRHHVVEGIIELNVDPMSAEYDAQEIISLVLPEYILD